jgi:hypothetical protein
MKKTFLALLGSAAALFAPKTQAATTVFTDNFATGYTEGNLIGPVNTAGQNSWAQTGSVTSGNPITILNNRAVLASGSAGQDAYKAFSEVVDVTKSGNYLLTTINFSITNAANTTGDYFFHLSSPVGTTSVFFQRLYSRSATGGFQLGINGASGSASAVYGSTVLSLDTPYEVVIKWDFISGVMNDALTVYVNPTEPILTNNTAYTSATWAVTEPTTVAAANLRIGSSSATPGVLVNSIQVQAIPEPGTCAFIGLGTAFLFRRVRRKPGA